MNSKKNGVIVGMIFGLLVLLIIQYMPQLSFIKEAVTTMINSINSQTWMPGWFKPATAYVLFILLGAIIGFWVETK